VGQGWGVGLKREGEGMVVEASPSLERVYYECRLYGDDIYYAFAQYCFWRMVVRTINPWWIHDVPAYYRLDDVSEQAREVVRDGEVED
jgi:hypothetical protein